LHVFTVVVARGNGARRLRRFRVAQSLWRCGFSRAPGTGGRWSGLKAALLPRLVGALNTYGRFPSAGRGPSEAVLKTPPFLPAGQALRTGTVRGPAGAVPGLGPPVRAHL